MSPLKAMRAVSAVLTSAVAVALLTSGIVGTHPAGAQRGSAKGVQQSLVEAPGCGDRDLDPPSPDDVVTRPTVFVEVDGTGRIVAAATNTGCAPRRGDDAFLVRPDGDIVQSMADVIAHCEWTGDFTVPGRFQAQSCGTQVVGGAPPHRQRRPMS